MAMKIGICRLCNEEKPLLNKSHIIPDFMYQNLYDADHKLIAFNPVMDAKGEGYIKKPSSGEYEGGILCKECDGIRIKELEDYVSEVLYGTTKERDKYPESKKFKSESGQEYFLISNLDYTKYKLFYLSILWRASITSRQNFSEVRLGPYEDKLRQMILHRNPGEVYDFPILFATFSNAENAPKDLITAPRRLRSDNRTTAYAFVISGLIFYFFVGGKSQKMPPGIVEHTITKDGNHLIACMPKGMDWPFLFNLFGLRKGI